MTSNEEHDPREGPAPIPQHADTEGTLSHVARPATTGADGSLAKQALARALRAGYDQRAGAKHLSDAERVQGVVFRAIEMAVGPKALALGQKAPALDVRDGEALRLRAELLATSPAEFIEGLTSAVEACAAALGEAYFEENRGAFYSLLPTRSYMHARSALAAALTDDDQADLACEHYAALLELDPNDNQAHRFPLLGLLLQQGDTQRARALADQFPDDGGTMQWGRVLLCWLEGKESATQAALQRAAECNAFVAAHLQDTGSPAGVSMPYYTPGAPSEAAVVMDHVGRAFKTHAGFTPWLLDALAQWDFDRASEWIGRQELKRGDMAPEWAEGFFAFAAKSQGAIEPRADAPLSDTDIAWYRLMAVAPDLRAEDGPGYGYAACAAVRILARTYSEEAARCVVGLLVESERNENYGGPFADALELAFEDLGPLAVEPALAALDAGHEGIQGLSWLLDTLAYAGVHDERILAYLTIALPGDPGIVAGWMGAYGDRTALPLLGRALDRVLAANEGRVPEQTDDVVDLCDAIERLDGSLTPAQERSVFALGQRTSRMALGPGGHLDYSPTRQKEPEEPATVGPLHAPERPGRNEACWCGSQAKYKRCHLREDEIEDST